MPDPIPADVLGKRLGSALPMQCPSLNAALTTILVLLNVLRVRKFSHPAFGTFKTPTDASDWEDERKIPPDCAHSPFGFRGLFLSSLNSQDPEQIQELQV